jgi:hypothetical protein
LDRADAEKRLERISDDRERELLRRWIEDGYVVLDQAVPSRDTDALVDAMNQLWEAERPIDGLTLTINDVRIEPDGELHSITHAELVALPPIQRKALLRRRAGGSMALKRSTSVRLEFLVTTSSAKWPRCC